MFKRNGKSGFTLLELLIVVIIVSILAAIALPRFGLMTRKARSTEAANAIGALLTAETLYYQEYGVFATLAQLQAGYVDVNQANFTYEVTPNGSTNAVAEATGVASTPTAGIIVTGTVNNTGGRTAITTTGL